MNTDGARAASAPASLLDAAARIARRCDVSLEFVDVIGAGSIADRDAGRRAASKALARIAPGLAGEVIGRRDDGRPIWPALATGSIAHAGGVAVAVAAAAHHGPNSTVRNLGVDLEVGAALPADDATAVLDRDERTLVAGSADPDRLATLLWAAKEAAFKAWCEGTDGGLGPVDPVDIHVSLGWADGDLLAVRVDAQGPLHAPTTPVGPLHGWCAEAAGYVLVVVTSTARRSLRGPHQGVDGIASDATTMPSAANATT